MMKYTRKFIIMLNISMYFLNNRFVCNIMKKSKDMFYILIKMITKIPKLTTKKRKLLQLLNKNTKKNKYQ